MTDELASRRRRTVATLLDLVLVPAFAIALMLVTGVLEHAEDWADASQPLLRIFLLGLVSYLVLNGYLLAKSGQTLGKVIMGIAIVSNVDGKKLSVWKLLGIRALFFPTLYLLTWPGPCVLPLLDQGLILRKNRRCLHDVLSGSRVVRRRSIDRAP